jgi:hypothetical protein
MPRSIRRTAVDDFGETDDSENIDVGSVLKTLAAQNVECERMRLALTEIRDRSATMKNGGAWAAGIATLCLGTLKPTTLHDTE